MMTAQKHFTPPPNAKTFFQIKNPILKRPKWRVEYIAELIWDIQQAYGVAKTIDLIEHLPITSYSQALRYIKLAEQGGWVVRFGKRGGWYVPDGSSLPHAA